jgi:hypothetical protein
MSYDLFLSRDEPLGLEEYEEFFSARTNYKCSGGQAVYQNETTGVYFVFDFEGKTAESPHWVTFNLNYCRPHFFGLEAASEVEALIEHFEFGIDDPQSAGMANGPFSVNGFLKGWNQGNAFGYRAVLDSANSSDRPWTRPSKELEAIWKWNFERDRIQESLQDDIFVPRVFWGTLDERLYSMVVWPDGIPTLIPDVEILVVGREELAPRRFFRKANDKCYVPAERFNGLLAPIDSGRWPLPARLPGYGDMPPELRRFIMKLERDWISRGVACAC